MFETFTTAFNTSGIQEVMEYSFGGNTVGEYSTALLLFVFLWAVIRAFRLVGLSRLRKWAESTPRKFDEKFLKWSAEISPLFFAYLSAVIVLEFFLVLPVALERLMEGGFIILLIFEAMILVQKAVNFALSCTPLGKNSTTLHGTQRMFGIIIWSMGLLMVLSNLGVNITTLVASLGIGGIAIAFAIQHILGDIFSSFSIFFDKPFAEGDYVVVGEEEGEIKQIGIKTTRITAVGGEEIVMSNKELTESCIHNYGKLKRRRIKMITSVAFDTPLKKLELIDDILKKAISASKICEFDRVWFKKINTSSYDFETVYYVNSNKYIDYARAQEVINWAIIKGLEKESIEFALPTTVKIAYKK